MSSVTNETAATTLLPDAPETRIDEITLKNFRCFADLSIKFHSRLTVLVAPNGGGKTTILDAVARAWRLYVNTMRPDKEWIESQHKFYDDHWEELRKRIINILHADKEYVDFVTRFEEQFYYDSLDEDLVKQCRQKFLQKWKKIERNSILGDNRTLYDLFKFYHDYERKTPLAVCRGFNLDCSLFVELMRDKEVIRQLPKSWEIPKKAVEYLYHNILHCSDITKQEISNRLNNFPKQKNDIVEILERIYGIFREGIFRDRYAVNGVLEMVKDKITSSFNEEEWNSLWLEECKFNSDTHSDDGSNPDATLDIWKKFILILENMPAFLLSEAFEEVIWKNIRKILNDLQFDIDQNYSQDKMLISLMHSDVHRENIKDIGVNPMLPAKLLVTGILDNLSLEWSLHRTNAEKTDKVSRFTGYEFRMKANEMKNKHYESVAQKTNFSMLPLIAYYGTGRLLAKEGEQEDKKEQDYSGTTERMEGYEECLSSASRYKQFEDWFRRQSLAALAGSEICEIRCEIINEVVSTVLEPIGWKNLRWEFENEHGDGRITLEQMRADGEKGIKLPMRWLSDGIRNTCALVADIAHRCFKLNPHLGENAVKQTSGIVLIDEIDMHLHPEWQQTILGSLQSAFPIIQFIVTTHSPQVLTTVKNEKIRLLDTSNNTALPPQTPEILGMESSEALCNLQGVNPKPDIEAVRWYNDYIAAIETQADEQTKQKLKEKLIAVYGDENHPLLDSAATLERFQAFKLRRQQTNQQPSDA